MTYAEKCHVTKQMCSMRCSVELIVGYHVTSVFWNFVWAHLSNQGFNILYSGFNIPFLLLPCFRTVSQLGPHGPSRYSNRAKDEKSQWQAHESMRQPGEGRNKFGRWPLWKKNFFPKNKFMRNIALEYMLVI